MEAHKNTGFTLLELVMVLVIIGLLTGGILYGRELIRAGEVRKVNSQYQEYLSAANTFRNKYNCLPGDCDHATDFWPETPEGCDGGDPVGFPRQNTACNGNGNGVLGWLGERHESHGAWQQLANAGLVAGLYSGSYAQIGTWYTPDYNCPPVLSGRHCWLWWNGEATAIALSGMAYKSSLGTVLFILPSNFLTGESGGRLLTPREALQYDGKFDDGHPDSGQVMAAGDFWASDCTTPGTGPPDEFGSATGPFFYDLVHTGLNCTLVFKTGF